MNPRPLHILLPVGGTLVLLGAFGIILRPSAPPSFPKPFAKESPAPRAAARFITAARAVISSTPQPTSPVLQTGEPDADEPATAARIARRKTELRAAMDAAASLSDANLRTETLTRLCCQWAEFDPRGAIELAFDHHLDEAGGGVIENLAQQWAVVDLVAAREWVRSQPPGEARAELAARIGFVWSQSDPEAAADFVVANTSPGPVQTEAAISVLYEWARRDPQRALAWAREFPPGPLRDRAIKEAVAPVQGN
jgi:hypothetical protein